MNNALPSQEKFLEQLKSILPPKSNLADELTELLKVSKDTIYRRLRCQSTFSFDDITVISNKYGVSLDGLLQLDALQVSFGFNPIYEDDLNLAKYLDDLSGYIRELSEINTAKVFYAAEDIPFFRHLHYPTLSAFKIFYWNKAVLNNEKFKGKKFNMEIIPEKIFEINQSTFKSYCQINSSEIWTEETLSSSLKQVEYFWEADLFETREQVLLVIQEIQLMMDELKMECEEGYKDAVNQKGEFKLYNSEVLIGNNCVLVEPGDSKLEERVFLGHNTFNSISTYNAAFCKETRLWIDNLIKKSMLLSGTAEKQRAVFFKKMSYQINTLKNKVEMD